ncbi:YgjP-like metallopeptidase domain-containing protein [Metamycoplasma buccale]|uniref:YgjP-like metallopeptidase domain-containing protein n=1 Tax=Metamycoplasma buccale TaxID=55602 RepID=UPI00398F1D4A
MLRSQEKIDSITINGIVYFYKVIFTNNKNVYFELKNDTFILKTPIYLYEQSYIKEFVKKGIISFLNRKSKPSLEINLEEKYFYYFGNKVNYIFDNNQISFFDNDNEIVLACNSNLKIEEKIWEYLIKKLALLIENRIEIFSKIICPNVTNISFKIKAKKSAWGTNYLEKKLITFSKYLALFNPKLIEYVVVHELIHFNFNNHSPEFWNAIKKLIPNYKKVKENINKHNFSFTL